jgi:isoleucyl-tRNA synthetase
MEENKKSESALSSAVAKSAMADKEEKVLAFWEENKIFQKSLEKESTKGEFVFYEGPPTANGKPGIHHLEARAFKDIIPRYKTMQGFHVRRKGGWDTHGLPVELQVEKKLGLNSKKAIEEYGIGKFNQECKQSVWDYLEFWNTFTKRIGYWVDQENPYITYENNYIESLWNVVGEVNKKDLLYKDYKVLPWCPRCGTALSSHELAQGYETVKDLSLYVKFRVVSSPDAFPQVLGSPSAQPDHSEKHTSSETFILAWTTTPWTLPGNVALAVGKDVDYVKISINTSTYILAKSRLSIIKDKYEIISEFKGSELVGLEYEPLFPYLENTISESEKSKLEKAFKVYSADFVTTEDGTGIVHTASV